MFRKSSSSFNSQLALLLDRTLQQQSWLIHSITSLNSHNQPVSSFQDLSDRGFHPKYSTNDPWTPEEMKILRNAIIALTEGRIQPQVKSWSYYIAHYEFHDKKSADQVEHMIQQQIRRRFVSKSKQRQ
jgi:hypothetical protein